MRLPLLSLLLAALALGACDSSNYDDGYDDGYYDGQGDAPTNGATFVDFTLDRDDYDVSTDTQVASFESDDIDDTTDLAALRRVLSAAGDGDLVVAYIVTDVRADGRTFSALPFSRAEEAFIALDVDNDGTIETGEGFPFVNYTLGYEYSFDNADFYFDVVSSARGDGFMGGARAFFDAILTEDLGLRVVTVPATRGSRPAVDMTDYAAVKAAYNLPD